MNCSFSCTYDIGVQLLLFFIPIAVKSPCCPGVMSSRFSVILCVRWGGSDSGVGVSEISMPISSRCCSKLRAQQFGVSAAGRYSGQPWNLLQCGCWCLCGLFSSPAATLAVSFDLSCTLWMSDIFVAVIISVGHLNPSPAIFLGRWSSFVGKDVMLFDILLSSFYAGLSSFSLISSSDDLRCGA